MKMSRAYIRRVEFKVLGPIDATVDGQALSLGGPKPRLLLAVLLAAEGKAVSTSTLIDALWPDEPPATARKTVQVYIHGLRGELGDVIETVRNGYALTIDDNLDAVLFEKLCREAKELIDVDPARASQLIREALDLWSGPAYTDFEFEPAMTAAITRLEEARLDAVADRVDADLALGMHHELIGELRSLAHDYPFRERFTSQLMLSLYRAGRQGDALRAFAQTQRVMRDEMGIDPSAELNELESRILSADESLSGPETAAGSSVRAVRGYELRRKLSDDGQRVVYQGYQRSVGRQVAIVVLGPTVANDPDFIARFQADTERVAQLDHPGIAYVYDTWREPDAAYQITRWIDGRTLGDRLAESEMGVIAGMSVLEQVGAALAHAHRSGVVHGRVSLENIIVTDDNKSYLTDFAVGTPEARHPPSVDVRDLAAVAHHVLAGEPPRLDNGVYELTPAGHRLTDGMATALEMGLDSAGYERVEDLLRALRQSTATDVSGLASDEPQPFTELRNPYKGLQAFQETDAADFFGRESLIERLHQKLEEHRLVAVVGPSGAGKSSVVKAGLAPRLGDSGRRWLTAQLYPGAFPFEELAGALVRVAVNRADLSEELMADDRGLTRVLKQILPDDGSELVLIIDQFEEIFSMVDNEETRVLFLAGMSNALADPRSRLRVVLTMRADFFDRPLQYPEFGALVEQGLVPVTVPDPDGLALAISQPAAAVGLEIEPGLTPEIVRDVSDQPGGLPLLQYALTELFRRRSSNRLTLADYRDSGGVLGALGRRAEDLYLDLPANGREAIRQVMLRLVSVDEGSGDLRRRVSRTELNTLDVDRAALDQALVAYGASRLLTFDLDPITRSPTVEVAHEALIREWDRLGDWLESQREDLVMRRRLDAAMTEWQQSEMQDGYLIGGGRLAQFTAWAAASELALSDAERSFLAESEMQEAARGRRRVLVRRAVIGGLAVTTVVALLLAALAVGESRSADAAADRADQEAASAEAAAARADQEAALARAGELALEARVTASDDPELGAALALKSIELLREAGDENAGLGVQSLYLARSSGIETVVLPSRGATQVAWLGPDRLATWHPSIGQSGGLAADPATIIVTDSGGAGLVEIRGERPFTGMTPAREASVLVATHLGGPSVSVWDTSSGAKIRDVTIPGAGWVENPGEASDARLVAVTSGSVPHTTYVLDSETWTLVGQFGTSRVAALSPDGRLGASVDDQRGAVVLADVETGSTRLALPVNGEVLSLVYSPDGASILVGEVLDLEATVTSYDITDGTVRWQTVADRPDQLAWSPDGSTVAVGGLAGSVVLLNATSGRTISTLPNLDRIWNFDFGPTSDELVVGAWPRTTLDTRGFLIADLSGAKANNAGDHRLVSVGIDVEYVTDQRLVARLVDSRVQTVHPARGSVTSPNMEPLTGSSDLGIHAAASTMSVPTTSGVDRLDLATLQTRDRIEIEPSVLAVSPDGSRILAGPYIDRSFELFFSAGPLVMFDDSGSEIWSENTLGFGGIARGAQFSPDGTLVAIVADDGVLTVIEADSGKIIHNDPVLPRQELEAVDFSPDGVFLLVGSDRSVNVYQLTGTDSPGDDGNDAIGLALIATHEISTGGANPRAVPGTTRTVITTLEGAVKLWDWSADEVIWEFEIGRRLARPAVSPDGTRFAIVVDDYIREYYLDVDILLAELGDEIRPLTEAECIRYLGTPDC